MFDFFRYSRCHVAALASSTKEATSDTQISQMRPGKELPRLGVFYD